MSNSVDPDETAHYSKSVDPGETAHDGSSHLDLRCLQKPTTIAQGSERVKKSVPDKIQKLTISSAH